MQELVGKICEVVMLLCFGFSWPINLAKSIKTKSTKGKSLLFLILIDTGYVVGIAGKFITHNLVWWVLAVYFFNFAMVTSDLVMYFVNKNREKKISLTKNEMDKAN